MKNFRTTIVLLFALCCPALAAEQPHISKLTDTDAIHWDTSLQLPASAENGAPHLGLAGVFAGYADGKLVIGGGANFPDGTPEQGGG